MIAAGSLFTSCVNYDEPVGVQGLREAKASYLEALSGLRAADAELQKAYAEVQKAVAAKTNADAAYRQAEVKAKEIANEQAKAEADQAIAKAKAEAEEAALTHQYAMAQLNQSLEKLQKKIAAEALSLTAEEKNVIQAAINYYNAALTAYNTAANEVASKEQTLWEKQNGQNADEETLEEEKARYEEEIADAKANITQYQAWAEKVVNDPNIKAWQEYVDGLKAEATQAAFDTNTLKAQRIILESTTLKDAKTAAENAWAEWKKAHEVEKAESENVEYEAEMPASMNPAMKDLMDSYAWKITGAYPWNWSIDAAANNVENYLYGVEDSYSDAKKLGFKGIVETIEKSNLLEPDTTTVKAAEKTYNDAVAKYEAYADTLKAGLQAYIDSNEAVIAAIADTVAKAAALAAEKDTLDLATAAVDSIYSIDTINARNLVKARNELAKAAKAIKKEGLADNNTYSTADLDSVLKAIKAFVTAKQGLFGPQSSDSLSYNKKIGNAVVVDKKAILDLNLSDLSQTIESICISGGSYHFKVSNIFTNLAPLNDPSVIGGYTKVSYPVQYTEKLAESGEYDWTSYEDALIGHDITGGSTFILTQEMVNKAKLSKPAAGNEANEVLTVIFKALGLVDYNFWDDTWADYVLTDSDPWEIFKISVKGIEGPMYITVDTANFKFNVAKTINPKVAYQPQTYTAAETAKSTANSHVSTAQTALNTAKGKFNTAKQKAEDAYTAIKGDFFGNSASVNNIPSDLRDKDSLAVEIQSQIIEKIKDYITYVPANVGSFENSNIEVIGDVIAEVSASLSKYFDDDDDVRYFVFGHSTKPSLFGATVVADFNYTLVANSKDAKDYFAAVKEWVNGLEAAYKANVEAYEAANAEYYAYQEKAFGIKKQTDDETIYYHNYFDRHYNVYKAPKAGQQKAIYDQYLKPVVDQIKALNKQISTNDARIKDIADLLAKVEPLSAKALAIANNVKFTDEEIKSFATSVANLKTYIQNKIDEQEGKIDAAEWALKKIEAGVDTKTIDIEKAERELDEAEAALAEAEQVLKLAKAEYDAAMAKYVK